MDFKRCWPRFVCSFIGWIFGTYEKYVIRFEVKGILGTATICGHIPSMPSNFLMFETPPTEDMVVKVRPLPFSMGVIV